MSALGFELPKDVESIVDGLESFLQTEVIARHKRHADLLADPRALFDKEGHYVVAARDLIREVRMASARAGFYNVCVPEEYGGAGLGNVANYATWEAVYHICGSHNWLEDFALAHWAYGPSKLLGKVTPEAAERIVSPLVRGEQGLCFGMSEPGAGSDVQMIKTRAERDGTGWRISGRKTWTSNAAIADYIVVFAVTDPDLAARRRGGISAFLVPTDAPGFALERALLMQGDIGSPHCESSLDGVRVEPWQLVGELNEGFQIGLLGVSLGRIYNAAKSVGLARWALEKAIDYTKTRQTFGRPISEHQGVAFQLAESAMEVHAAHLMGLNAAMLLDKGQLAIKELSMAKTYSVEVATEAIDRAIQAHGALGLTNELGLVEAQKRTRVVQIADGTREILRRTIWHRLQGGDTEL